MQVRAWIKDSILITWNNMSNLIQLWRNILMPPKFKKIVILLVIAIFVIPVLTACGSGQNTVDVKEDSFSITMPSSLKAGNITFHVSNIDSSANHEFIIIKTDLAPDKLPLDGNGNADLTAQGVTVIDQIKDLAPGASQDLTTNLTPGKYVALCDLPGHYKAGMFIGFVVK
jgi:uncharacterized cupredoxin-like copper-binding protein